MLTYAKVSELFSYLEDGIPFAKSCTLKGHAACWVSKNGAFTPGQRVLDVGGGRSSLAYYIQTTLGCEVWVLDDYDSSEYDGWDPTELLQEYPTVKYIFSKAGDFTAEIPDQYFDCIYSISVLEHIPSTMMHDVFLDMIRMLKPGGIMLHCIDLGLSNYMLLPHPELIRKMALRIARGRKFSLTTPDLLTVSSWRRFLRSLPSLSYLSAPSAFNELSILLDADTLYDPPLAFFLSPPEGMSKKYCRRYTLDVGMRKALVGK